MGVNYIWNKSLQKFVQSSVKDPKRTRQVKMRFSVIGDREMPHGVNLYAILLPAVNGTGKPTAVPILLPNGIGYDDPHPMAQSRIGRRLGMDKRCPKIEIQARIANNQNVHTSNLPAKSVLATFPSGSFTGTPEAAD